MIVATPTIYFLSWLFLMMIVVMVYFAIFFMIFFVVAWGILQVFKPILRILQAWT